MNGQDRASNRWEIAAITAETVAGVMGYMVAFGGAAIIIHTLATIAGLI